MSKNVPEVRFEGFSDEWEIVKLKEVTEISSGGTPDRSNTKFWNGDIPWATTAEVNYSLITRTNEKITKSGLLNSSAKLMPKGTILLAMYGQGKTRGQVAILGIEATTNQANANIQVRQSLYNYFIYYQLVKEYENLRRLANEGGQANLSLGIVKELYVSRTKNLNEQIHIGNFFKQLDERITIANQELTRLKETKQGFLQKMFPKDGETMPKIRFGGFDDEWENVKLEKIALITMGQSPNSVNYTSNPNDYILVQGNADIKNGKVVPRVWSTQITKTADVGDIILSVRAPVGDVGITEYNIVIGRGVAAVKANDFIHQTLLRMKYTGYWTRYVTGSTFESINSNDLKEALVIAPHKEEQTAIGNFLKKLDDTIALQQQELDLLKETKKGFLQKMFI